MRFPGQYFDQESGLYYNRFRYYEPQTGRYLSSDPLGQRTGPNVYEYAHNSPLKFFDSYGLFGSPDCSYYDDSCAANGGTYECRVAPGACNRFPHDAHPGGDSDPVGNRSDCVRQCLQEKHQDRKPNPEACDPNNQIPLIPNVDDHINCVLGCLSDPENPYNPGGPPLPSQSRAR